MPSGYPADFDALPTTQTNGDTAMDLHPALHNDANAAINAIQETLGVNPQGVYGDVAERFAAIEGALPGAIPDASETEKGKVELATVAEAEAGTDAVRAVTAAGVAAAIAMPRGVVRATRQTSAPSAAASGEAKYQFRNAARFPMLEAITDVGDSAILWPSMLDPLVSAWWVEVNSIAYKNLASALSSSGTVSQATIHNTIGAQNYATVASANSGAGLFSASALYRDGSSIGDGGLFWGLINLPDASYGSGSSGAKIVVGIHDTVAHNGNRPGGNGVLFEWNSNQSDTNWQFIVSDGGSDTIVDTGVPFDAQASYIWMIHIPRGGSACYGRIGKVGGSSASVAASAMPTNTAMYYLPARLTTLGATARNIRASSGGIRHGGAY